MAQEMSTKEWMQLRRVILQAMEKYNDDIFGDLEAFSAMLASEVSINFLQKIPSTKEEEEKKPCEGFQWIGQSFAYCDNCSVPFWEHTHERRLNKNAGPFGYEGEKDPWVLVDITPETADKVRRKWDPNYNTQVMES